MDLSVFARGSKTSRTRLYQINIARFWKEISSTLFIVKLSLSIRGVEYNLKILKESGRLILKIFIYHCPC
ncbi:hypothetical protein [Pedobacter sp.]|uniref:DUF6934 family protein n=1 Tax=Pedobacter sp. TaxID=1411316 RepID=UPI00356B3921